MGVFLPRTTFDQVLLGLEIATIEDAIPGDLIFFENTSWFQTGVTHVGIYIGNHQFIHASGLYGAVVISPLNDDFYEPRWHSIRRIILPP
jgi:cell wall-associated NlpC family hydrolase